MTPSNDRQLSNTLVRLNLVTQRQIDQAIALQATDHPDMSLTDILVKYRMVDATDVESARSGLPHAAEAGEDPLIGRVVGGCHIEREIGRGGMGVVYLARDRSLSHNVAIKILPAELTRDPTYLNRFRKEAQAVGRLDHPHIVALYQVGVESGTHFIAMQYANGGSVADWLRSEGTLPKTDATRIFDELLQALGAAHDSGIIHRDIKPENILLTKKGSSLLADFGVARDMSSVTVLTTTVGSVLGSPYYMAPELWDGRRATAQSDLFAAGVTFYYMLTGGVPFWGSSPMVVLKALVTAEPDLAQITDPALRSLISWLLQKKAKDRPPNAQAVRDVLAGRAVPPVIPDDQLLTQPVPIQHRPSERRAQTKDRARRWIGTFLLVLGVLVVGGIALLELSKDTPTLTSTPTPIPTRLKIAIGELKKGNIGLKWPPNRSSNPKYNRGWWEKEEVTLVVALPVPGSLRYFEGESPKLILRAKQTKAVVKDGKLQITLPAHELVKEDGASKEVTLSFETDKGDSFLDELCEIKDGFPVRGRFDFRPLEIKKAELIILPKQGALYQMKVLITVDAKDGIKNPSVRQTVGVWSETETICTFILSIDLDTLKGLWKGLEDFTIEDKFGNESARISPKDWTLGVDRNSTAEAEYKDTIKGIVEKWYIATGQEDHGKKSDELIGSLRKEKQINTDPNTIAIGELKKGNIGLKWPPNRSSNPKYNRGWWEKEEVTLVVALPVPGSLRYFEGESPKLILRAKQTKAVVKDGKLQITLPAHELVKEDGASKEVTLSFETDKGDSFLDELCEIKDGFPVRGRFDFRPLEIKKAELIILPKQGALYQMKVLITVDAKDGIKNPSVRQTVGVWSETETICTFILSIDLDTLKGLWKGLEDFTIEDKFGNESARISPKDWTLGVDRNSTAEAEYKDTIKGIVEKWYIATGQEDHGKKSDELIGSLRKEKEQGPPPITAASASLDTTKTVARVKYLLLVDDQGEPKKFKGRYYWMSTQELSCGAVKRLEGGEELVKVMLDSIKEHTEENINCTTRPKFPYVCAATDVKVILRFMKDQHNVEFELPTRAMWECANKMRPKSKKHHQRAKVTNKGHNNRSASFKELKDVDEYSIADPSTFGFLWGNVSEWVLDGGSRRPYGLSIGDKMQLSPDEGSAGMTGIRLVFWEKIPK